MSLLWSYEIKAIFHQHHFQQLLEARCQSVWDGVPALQFLKGNEKGNLTVSMSTYRNHAVHFSITLWLWEIYRIFIAFPFQDEHTLAVSFSQTEATWFYIVPVGFHVMCRRSYNVQKQVWLLTCILIGGDENMRPREIIIVNLQDLALSQDLFNECIF